MAVRRCVLSMNDVCRYVVLCCVIDLDLDVKFNGDDDGNVDKANAIWDDDDFDVGGNIFMVFSTR